jgi:hypothetical protein
VWGFAFSSHTCPVVVLLGGAIFFSIYPGLVPRAPPRDLRSSASRMPRGNRGVRSMCRLSRLHRGQGTDHTTARVGSSDPASGTWTPYWKCIPSCLSVRQITLQARVVCPGRPNRNVDGISKVAPTSRQAPDSVKLRTVHGSTAFFPRIIVPDLRARRRGVFRCSAIARK